MPNSEGKKRQLGRVEAMQKRKRKQEYTRINAAGVKTMEGRDSTQEEKYRMLVQNLPCAVYSAYPGKAGPTTFMSDKWKDWTGYSPEELYQNPEAWPKCIHPDDREKAANAYSRACQDNVPYNLEYRIVHKGTEQVRYVRDQGILSNNKKDDIIRVDGIITDVSELKRAERALQESEERFKNIFNNALVGLYRTTPDGRILMANPALVRMLGYDSFEELAKRNLEEGGFEPQYFRFNFKERIEAKGRVIGLEADWVRRDGTILSIRESAKAIRDEHGNILYYEGTVEDISERKRAEEELRRHRDHLEEMVKKRTAELTGAYETLKVENKERKRAEQALREVEREKTTVLENLSDLIVYRDRDMVTLWASKSMANWHGMSQEQIVGRICYKARYGREEPCEECHVIEAIKSGQRQELEKQIPDERCWHVIVNPVFDDSGQVIGTIEVSQDITERKRADQALRETTNLLETIFEHTHMLVAYLDPQFNFVRVNRAYAEADEHQPSFFPGRNHFDLYPDAGNQEIFRQVVETGQPYFVYAKPFEYAEHPEREISYWDWSLVPIKNQQGIVSGLVFTLADVTARIRAEEALKASEGKLNAMLQSISDHMSMMDKDLNILWANDEAKKIFGDDIVGKKCYEVYHGRQSPCEPHSCLTLRAFQDGGVHEHDTEDTDKDGNTAWLHCVANVALRNEEGEATAVLEISTDITERKRAEETLQESEERYRSLSESSPMGVFHTDKEGRVLYTNKRWQEITGLVLEESLGFGWSNALHPEDKKILLEEWDRCLSEEKGYSGEFRFVSKSGEVKWVYTKTAPIRSETGQVIGHVGSNEDITERMQAEEELRIREQKLRALLNAPTESAILADTEGTILDINRIAAQRLGKSAESLIGMGIYEYLPTDIAEYRINQGYEVVRSGKPVRFQDEREGRYYDTNIYPVFDDEGKVSSLAIFSGDITERKRAAGALKESEEKFRSLAEQSPNMIFINKKGRIVYANKKCEEVMEYKREELCSPDFDFRTLVAPESLGLINDNFAKHLRGEEVQPYDYSIISKKGERIEAINACKLIQYEGETAILGVITDITERKRAEQALRESEERLKILFESAPDTIYLIDSEGRFVDGNRAAMELIGFAKDEVIGKSLAEMGLLSVGQLSRAEENLKKVATGKLSGSNEYTLKRKDGSHVSVEVRTFPVKIGDKMLTLGIARDVTEQKRTEKELLEHQAKLKSLASQLSLTEERERHRLATELHDQISQSLVISKIKLDQLHKSSTSDEFSRPLEDISNCLGQIIDDTRTLTFDLSYPILYELGFEAAVAEWLTDHIQEKHGIETEFVDDGHQKPLDDDIRVLLFRNVRELLINIVKHAQANQVKVSIRKVNDNICVSVEDNGVGFDPVEVSSMAAKRAEFGLFSIRERLEQLGGLIKIDSMTGQGSKITMTAPLKCDDSTDRTQQ